MLLETALELGAKVRTNARVSSVDAEAHTVTLSTGEVLKGDIVIGADGAKGVCRAEVLGSNDSVKPTGLMMFKSVYAHIPVLAASERVSCLALSFQESRCAQTQN